VHGEQQATGIQENRIEMNNLYELGRAAGATTCQIQPTVDALRVKVVSSTAPVHARPPTSSPQVQHARKHPLTDLK